MSNVPASSTIKQEKLPDLQERKLFLQLSEVSKRNQGNKSKMFAEVMSVLTNMAGKEI